MANLLLYYLYRFLCRLRLADVTRLLCWDGTQVKWPALPAGYSVQVLSDDELADLRGRVETPESFLDSSRLPRSDRVCVALLCGDRIASYLWLGRHRIEAHNNFGQSAHLGTSIDLPDATSFVYNAWTHPEHRGRRLIGVMLEYISERQLLGTTKLLTTVDWTNKSSRQAFAHIGMYALGLVWRFGWGRYQLTLLPHLAHIIDLHLARTAPGIVVSGTTHPALDGVDGLLEIKQKREYHPGQTVFESDTHHYPDTDMHSIGGDCP